MTKHKHLLLYDGVCHLCNGLTQFILPRDSQGQIAFAALQSEYSAQLLGLYGKNNTDLDTVVCIADHETPSQRLLIKSDAVVAVLRVLKMPWNIAASLLQVIPRPIRDSLYDFVAANRYRIFGKSETCMLPKPEWKERFLD